MMAIIIFLALLEMVGLFLLARSIVPNLPTTGHQRRDALEELRDFRVKIKAFYMFTRNGLATEDDVLNYILSMAYNFSKSNNRFLKNIRFTCPDNTPNLGFLCEDILSQIESQIDIISGSKGD